MKSINVFILLLSAVYLSGCVTDVVTPTYKDHPNLKVAEMARARGDLPQAIHDYREIIKESLPCEEAYVGLGMALLDANAVDESKRTFEQTLGFFPKSAGAFVGMGAVYLTINQPENAIKSFNCALAIEPRNAKAINGLGIAYDMMGEHVKALAHYRAGIELDPTNVSYKSNLALSLALMGNVNEAIIELERLAASPCATPRVRQNLALAYGLSGNMKRARQIGKVDLSEDMVRNNISYIESVRKTKDYAGLLPNNHMPSLSEGRKWQERD
jgi:Flp pilus assembly protein TadD